VSTILDALQKARRERPADTEGYDVLDPKHGAPRRRNRRTMLWVVVLTIVATMVVLGLTGGALLLLLDRLDTATAANESTVLVVPPAGNEGMVATAAVTPPVGVVTQPVQVAQPTAVMPLATEMPGNTGAAELPVVGPENSATLPTPLPSAMVGDPGAAPVDLLPMSEPAEVQMQTAPPAPTATGIPSSGRSQDGMTLGSILIDAEDRIATINGVPLREGESYEDFKVLRITATSVQVQREGKPAVTLRAGR
jgi:hypothetical protein